MLKNCVEMFILFQSAVCLLLMERELSDLAGGKTDNKTTHSVAHGAYRPCSLRPFLGGALELQILRSTFDYYILQFAAAHSPASFSQILAVIRASSRARWF